MCCYRLILALFTLAAIALTSVEARRRHRNCRDTFHVCDCGVSGSKVQVSVSKCFEKDPLTKKGSCQICNRHAINGNFCSKFSGCETCVKNLNRCWTCPYGKTGPFCDASLEVSSPGDMSYYLDDVNNTISTYPIKVVVRRGEPLSGHRQLREDSCKYPSSVDTADIHCTIFVEKVVCSQACIWGYTLPEGKTRDISCTFKDNKWTPVEFQECKPYVNCDIRFKTSGEMKCIYNRVESGPNCELSCLEYNNQPEVPLTNHICMLTGEWNPPLPHCVVPDKTMDIVPLPELQNTF